MIYSFKQSDTLAGKYTHIIISGEEYGIPTSQVKSVVERPAVRKVPKAPDFIEGVANINGRIIPLLNPVKRLSLSAEENTTQESFSGQSKQSGQSESHKGQMVLVQLGSVLYGIMVDRVTNMSHISADIIEPMNPLMVKSDSPFIAGMAKLPTGLVYLMDLDAVIMSGIPVEKEDRTVYESFSRYLNDFLKPKQRQLSYKHLTFMIGEETYGIDASRLKGVSRPADMVKASSGPDYIKGVMNRFGKMLPVVDIAQKLEIASMPYSKESRVIWLDCKGVEFGMLVHQVVDFTHIMQNEIKSSLQMMIKENESHVKGVAMLNQGKKLITIIDADNLLIEREINEIKKLDEVQMWPSQIKADNEVQMESSQIKSDKQIKTKQDKKINIKTTDLLIFTVSDFELAVPTSQVSEVMLVQELKKIPKVPPFIKGVMPVRGELIPIMSLNIRFELPIGLEEKNRRIIIIKKENINYGILVDTVSGILKVDENDIVNPPDIIQNIEERFIKGIAIIRNTDRTPIVINVEELIKN